MLEVDADGQASIDVVRIHAYLDDIGLALDETTLRTLAGELGVDDEAFELRLGQWRINAPVALARAIVNGAVLTAALAAQGETSLTATVLSVIVPLMFDLEHVSVSAADRAIYAYLAHEAPTRKHVDDWYRSLPPDVRAEVTRLEFLNVVERLEEVGAVEMDGFDVITVDSLPAGRRRRLKL